MKNPFPSVQKNSNTQRFNRMAFNRATLSRICFKRACFNRLHLDRVHLNRVARILLICMILSGPGCSPSTRQITPSGHELLPEHIDRAIELSTAYLVNAGQPGGRFTYLVNPGRLFKSGKHYNIQRHAGALYALARVYHYQPNDDIRNVLLSAGDFLKSNSMIPPFPGSDMLGIRSLPSVTHTKEPPQFRLGTTGLGLAALSRVEQLIPGTTSIPDLHSLGRFLLHMQKPNGAFFTRYTPAEGGKNNAGPSLYDPGQAVLGLLMLNDLSPSEQWVTAAAKAMAYLLAHQDITTRDPWSLIACAKLLSLKNYPADIVSRRAVIEYTVRVCETIFQEQILYADTPGLIGGYSTEGRTTPTARRVEALAAALEIIGQKDTVLTNTIRSSMQDAVTFLVREQITQGRYAGGIPRRAGHHKNGPSFNNRAGEIRIDYVYHTLNALVEYKNVMQR